MNELNLIPCLSMRSSTRGMPSSWPYAKKALVGRSGKPFSIGSGITPPAPEIGWPPPSNIKDKLTASRAPFGQYPPDSGLGAPGAPSVPNIKPTPPNKVEVRKLRREVFE